MSDLNEKSDRVNIIDLSSFYFVRLFRGFSMSVQPGKMILAIIAVILLSFVGSLLDLLSGADNTVVSDDIYNFDHSSEIAWYAENCKIGGGDLSSVKEFRIAVIDGYTENILELIEKPVIKEAVGANPLEKVRSGKVYGLLEDKYSSIYEECRQQLKERYDITRKNTIEGFGRNKLASSEDISQFDFQQMRLLNEIEDKYFQIHQAMADGKLDMPAEDIVSQVIKVDVSAQGEAYKTDLEEYKSIKKKVIDVISLARALKIAKAMEGRGVFDAFAEFNLTRFHDLAVSLVLLDFEQVKNIVYDLAFGVVWMVKYHSVYFCFMYIIAFSILAIFGGAICRISALQITRGEHVGSMEALQFTWRRYKEFVVIPILPSLFVVVLGAAIAACSVCGSIPLVGPAFTAILLVLIFALGFLMAVVILGLTIGHGLMYPAVAVDNSDSFDSMSRAFTYIMHKPWHLASYTFIASVYGIICYVFLRSFVLIVFASVRTGFSPMWDIDAIWPIPTFTHLLPAIQWHLLCGSDTATAWLLRLGCLAIVLLLPGYACSYYYTTATQIYVLLRKHEDGTDMKECYLETHIDELLEECSKAEDDSVCEDSSMEESTNNEASEGDESKDDVTQS